MSDTITATVVENTETITATLVDNGETIVAHINELARGPAGDAETGGGVDTFEELTDKASADLPAINTPLATALGLLAPKASPTFTGTVTTSVLTVNGAATFNDSIDFNDGTIVGMTAAAKTDWRTALSVENVDNTSDATKNAAVATLTNKTINGGGNTLQRIPVTYSNTTDFTTTSTTFVDVTGLSFPVLANKKYAVVMHLIANKNDTNGFQVQWTGPASPTKFANRQYASGSAFTSTTLNEVTAFSAASSTYNVYNGDGYIHCDAIISNGGNAGTVQLQIRAVTGGTAKIYAGSWIQVTQLD